MALENIGLGGILTFDSTQAVSGMRRAQAAAERFKNQFRGITNVVKSVGIGVSQAGVAMRGLGVAALPASLAFGAGVNEAKAFQAQMSVVKSITRATGDEMGVLEAKAKQLGLTTVFSPTEAAEGMEFLSRAGFSVTEQVAALGPTLNAAAADGIELAQAANIISNTLKGLALDATEAGRAADVLALTSASTNTNMIGLGESMKFAAPQAKTLGIELEEIAALLGATADAGLRGTIGGTSLTQALVKLVKPTEKGAALLKQFNVEMTKTEKGGLDVIDVFKQINVGIRGISDVVERARAQTEIFGVRGQKAFAAAATAIDMGKLDELVAALNEAKGAASEMAEIRLDNLAGAFTLFTSAVRVFAIETGGEFLAPFTDGMKDVTSSLVGVVKVLLELNTQQGLTAETAKASGSTSVAVAQGIKDAIEGATKAWVNFRTSIIETISDLTGKQSPDAIRSFTRIATTIFLVTAALAPVALALGGIALFMTSVVVPAFAAIGVIAKAVFTVTVLKAIAVVGVGLLLFRKSGESVIDTLVRMADNVKSTFGFIKTNMIDPFVEGFKNIGGVFSFIGSALVDIGSSFKDSFVGAVTSILKFVKALAPAFRLLFRVIGGALADTAALALGAITIALGLIKGAVNILLGVVEFAFGGMTKVINGFTDVVISPLNDQFDLVQVSVTDLKDHTAKEFSEIRGMIKATTDFISPEFDKAFADSSRSMSMFKSEWNPFWKGIGKSMTSAMTSSTLLLRDIMKQAVTSISIMTGNIMFQIVDKLKWLAGKLADFADFTALAGGVRVDTSGLRAFSKRENAANRFGLENLFGEDKGGVQVANHVERGEGFNGPLDSTRSVLDQLDKVTARKGLNQLDPDKFASVVADAVAKSKTEITVKSKVCVDGKTIAKATAKHKQEISDRAGFKATPWQRRTMAEQGAAPVGGV